MKCQTLFSQKSRNKYFELLSAELFTHYAKHKSAQTLQLELMKSTNEPCHICKEYAQSLHSFELSLKR